MKTNPSRFALFYGLYFALLGCIAPYWSLYLQHLEFSARDIGLLMAMFGAVRIVGPNLWASQAHRFRGPVQMIRLAGLLTVVAFTLIFFARDFLTVGLVMVIYGFFWAAMLPQYEVLCMQSLGNEIDLYGRIRVWGSIGFVISVLLIGAVFDVISVSWLPVIMWVFMLLITANAWGVQDVETKSFDRQSHPTFRRYLFTIPVIGFVLVNVLLQIAHGPYYTFFSIFLSSHDYSGTQIGLFWAVGVIAEVILFWQFGRIMHWFSWRGWFVLSLLLTALRWLIVGYMVEQMWVLLLIQILHAFSFGVMHAVSMRYVQALFPEWLQARGQALYSSVGFGVGGAMGAYLSGVFWEPLGGALVFLLAGVVALAAAPIAWLALKEQSLPVKYAGSLK